MAILIKNGYILTVDPQDRVYEKGDVLIEGDEIIQIGAEIACEGDIETVMDAEGKLVMPGLVNAHLHSCENFWRGEFDNMPLEPWMMYCLPLFDYGPFPERWLYLRTMLGAMEMVKGGVTTVQDDPAESPALTVEGRSAIFSAYRDIGMRACVTANTPNRLEYEKVPYIRSLLPKRFIERIDGHPPMVAEEIIEANRALIKRWHESEGGRLRIALSCSAPQRSTDKYLLMLDELSKEFDLPLNMHIYETKVQRVTGQEFYGKSIIKHVHELGILSPRANIAHAVWVDDEDIRLMADAQTSVTHNPVSNLKLGSGIMPLRKLLEAGVNVALGTDGMSSNDTQSMFEAMKTAALLHKVTHPDYHQWPSSDEVLRMATVGGARSCLIDNRVGTLREGMKADIILVKLNTITFTPLNNVKNQLVYCENGSSVETSIVNGHLIMENRRILMVDEAAILEEIRGIMPEFRAHYERAVKWGQEMAPYYAQVYFKCARQRLGVNRWGGDEDTWTI